MSTTAPSGRDVRTFRAADPRAALEAVKTALGEDAIIIDTRQVGGGLWSRPQIEITASTEPPLRAPVPKAERPPAPAADRAVQSELGAIRRVVEELRARIPSPSAEPASSPAASSLYRRLVQRGVEPAAAQQLLRRAVEDRGDRGDLIAAVRAVVEQKLVAGPAPWQPAGPRVVALVGPTGVGKTTTIAKIAARALLETQQKVALVTVDNYRIGAREHLARYAEIMRLPLHVATDRDALVTALARAAQADLVLIDTAGRSDAEAIAAQGALLRTVPGIELHLALSAAAGAREMRAAARRFRDLAPSRLVFTKLDEAADPASILAAALALPRPVSCIADGQRVPDDLHAVTSASLADIVVGKGGARRDPDMRTARS